MAGYPVEKSFGLEKKEKHQVCENFFPARFVSFGKMQYIQLPSASIMAHVLHVDSTYAPQDRQLCTVKIGKLGVFTETRTVHQRSMRVQTEVSVPPDY